MPEVELRPWAAPELPGGMLRLASIVEESIVDGPGLRFVLFTQGCPHNCQGCHNPNTHSPKGGTQCHFSEVLALYDENPLLKGITFSGGEPFCQAAVLCELAEAVQARGGDIVTYTGYTYERLMRMVEHGQAKDVARLLELTDLLIDGPYIEAQRDLELAFRGSTNQRLLDRVARQELATA